MQVINYQTSQENFNKLICSISDKIYNAGDRALMLMPEILLEEVDKLLWTFGRRKFIPHATIQDKMPEDQPILLSPNFTLVNKPKHIVLLKNTPADFSTNVWEYLKNTAIERIIFLDAEINPLLVQERKKFLANETKIKEFTHFIQQGANWQKL